MRISLLVYDGKFVIQYLFGIVNANNGFQMQINLNADI